MAERVAYTSAADPAVPQDYQTPSSTSVFDMAFLEVLKGPPIDPVELTVDSFSIGRQETCDLVLASSTVSREHARIERGDNGFFIVDCHSRHGTMINGNPLTKRMRLANDDRIAICGLLLRFQEAIAAKPKVQGNTGPMDEEVAESMIVSTQDLTRRAESTEGDVDPILKLRAVTEILRCLQDTVQIDALLEKVIQKPLPNFPPGRSGGLPRVGRRYARAAGRADPERHD